MEPVSLLLSALEHTSIIENSLLVPYCCLGLPPCLIRRASRLAVNNFIQSYRKATCLSRLLRISYNSRQPPKRPLKRLLLNRSLHRVRLLTRIIHMSLNRQESIPLPKYPARIHMHRPAVHTLGQPRITTRHKPPNSQVAPLPDSPLYSPYRLHQPAPPRLSVHRSNLLYKLDSLRTDRPTRGTVLLRL